MTEFLAILSLYYLCDATAAMRPMSMEEVHRCTETYDQVKIYFAPGFELAPRGTLARFEQMSAAYIAFQAWQDANPGLVGDMRQDAWDQARAYLGTAG